MRKNTYISDSIVYTGVDDKTLDLFESQYAVPNGVSYNSYVIFDEKITIMDTADKRGTGKWLENLNTALNGRTPEYLVISHMEPDHSGSLMALLEQYPALKVVGNAKTFPMMEQFTDFRLPDERKIVVTEGGTLTLGTHTLQFFMAPMVHWPEVMVTYEQSDRVLFSADGFGKFGALDTDEDWDSEAGRYYFNIVGKFGAKVQELLKKAAALDIRAICPLHGPVLTENLEYYIGKYQLWSAYEPEDGGVTIACASIHGNTMAAAETLAEFLREQGAKVFLFDLSRDDMSRAVEHAFRHDKLVLAAATYDGGAFPCMEDFLHHLKSKNYQKRTIAYIQNGSWEPTAARAMKDIVAGMKNITEAEPVVTIHSSMKEADITSLKALAGTLLT